MKKLVILALLALSLNAHALKNGANAPDFSLPGLTDKTVSLSQYKGKVVVLEWLDTDCAYSTHYYKNHHMQDMQKKYTDKDVVWLSVLSDGTSARMATQFMQAGGAKMTDILFDKKDKVRKAYGAKTAPHFFVIDAQGRVAYQGAIDDIPSKKAEDAKADNFVARALDEVLAGHPVTLNSSEPYGCKLK